DPGHGNVRVQMLVLFAVRPVRGQFRRMLEVDRESVPSDGRIERLILEIKLKAEPVTIVSNRSIQIVDQKLRSDPGNLRSTTNCYWRHLMPRRVMVYGASPAPSMAVPVTCP